MKTLPKRAIGPVFWLLFGAGGMVSALFGTGLVILTGFILPAAPPDYQAALAAARLPLVKLVFWGIVSLFFWHGAERLYLTLHDMRAGPKFLLKLSTYGSAGLLTLITFILLLTIGFRP